VRAGGVVVDPPFFDDVSCLVEIGEQVLVEALVTQTAVEALYEAILHGFAGGNVVIVSKRLGWPYRSGRSRHWVKSKNPAAPAVKREGEEDWAR
jgi:ATP-dependent DNA ligase